MSAWNDKTNQQPPKPCNFWVGKSFVPVKPLDKLIRSEALVKYLGILVGLALCLQPAMAGKRRPATGVSHPPPNDGPAIAKILAFEEQRTVDQSLLNYLHHPSSRVRRAAILALGRISDRSAIGDLAALLNKRHYPDKAMVAFALGLFTDEVATTVLVQHLAMQKDPAILRQLYLSLGRQGSEKYVAAVTKPVREGGPITMIEPSCLALGMLWSKPSEDWKLPEGLFLQLARALSSRQPYSAACAFAASRYKGSDLLIPTKELIKNAQESGSTEIKSYIARVLGKSREKEAVETLLGWAVWSSDASLRIEATKALASHPYSEKMREVLAKNLLDRNSSVVVQALFSTAAQGTKAAELAPKVESLFAKNDSLWVRLHALRTLGEIDIPTAKKRMEEVFQNGPPTLLPAAISILAINSTPEDVKRIASYLQHDSPKLVVEMLDALSIRHEGDWPAEWTVALRKSVERGDPAISAAASQLVTRLQWKDFAPSLAIALSKLGQNDQIESKLAILSALGTVGGAAQVNALQIALADPQRTVAQAAADALKNITGQDFSQRVPANSRFPNSTFEMSELDHASRADVILKTNRGEIVLSMSPEAPLTALNFTRLVKKKFYDGLTFHRVIPHFVAQGGDPRGDGYGGSGYLVRDEFTQTAQTRATVGLATAGRDTGGSQFYINLGPNRHLDGRYTVFARVSRGMDVADKLEEGDRILTARVR
jgi:cyclophilin family peptidyl-prolyl cis-trans isomerase/HEAT repeat protein